MVWVLQQLGSAVRDATAGDAAGSIGRPASTDQDVTPLTVTQGVGESHGPAPGPWTEALVGDFLAELEPMDRRMALQVWRAGAAGIHRSYLYQRTELTPAELRSLLMRIGHALRRFQQDREVMLSRPVAANSPLQSYFVDPDFAAVAAPQVLGERMPRRLVDGEGRR